MLTRSRVGQGVTIVMEILKTTEVRVNGDLVLGRLEVGAFRVQQGTGAGEFRFKCKLPGFLHLSTETFSSLSAAFQAGAGLGRSKMDEVILSLRVPAKTAEMMKYVSIFPLQV